MKRYTFAPGETSAFNGLRRVRPERPGDSRRQAEKLTRHFEAAKAAGPPKLSKAMEEAFAKMAKVKRPSPSPMQEMRAPYDAPRPEPKSKRNPRQPPKGKRS